MKEILKTMPETVVYRYDREEFEKMIRDYLSKEVDEPVCVNVELEPDYIDLIRINLDDEANSELLLTKLDEKGFPCYDETTLMRSILSELFHPSCSVYAYMKSDCRTHFDVLVHVKYEAFRSLLDQANETTVK